MVGLSPCYFSEKKKKNGGNLKNVFKNLKFIETQQANKSPSPREHKEKKTTVL